MVIILWVSSNLGSSLSAAPNIVDLSQRKHPQNLNWIEVGYGNVGFQSRKPILSPKWGKIERVQVAIDCLYEISISVKMYNLEWPVSEIQSYLWQNFVKLVYLFNVFSICDHVNCHESISWNKQLAAHSVSIEIYRGIARFSCDSTVFLFISFLMLQFDASNADIPACKEEWQVLKMVARGRRGPGLQVFVILPLSAFKCHMSSGRHCSSHLQAVFATMHCSRPTLHRLGLMTTLVRLSTYRLLIVGTTG